MYCTHLSCFLSLKKKKKSVFSPLRMLFFNNGALPSYSWVITVAAAFSFLSKFGLIYIYISILILLSVRETGSDIYELKRT